MSAGMTKDERCIVARKLCCGSLIFATGTSYGIDADTKMEIA